MTITADDIRRVRSRIELEHHWTTDAWARDAKGNPLDNGADGYAVCWCLVGAAECDGLVDTADFETTLRSYTAFADVLGFDSVDQMTDWQDQAGHARVIHRLNETIERLERAA